MENFKIQSKEELLFDSENGITGIVEREFAVYGYKSKEKKHLITIENRCQGRVIQTMRNYPTEMIDGLFSQIGDPILPAEGFTSELSKLVNVALFTITGAEGIYRKLDGSVTTSKDWEIVVTDDEESTTPEEPTNE